MWQILTKDLKNFTASPTGLVVAVVFLTVLSLFLWMIEGGYNLLYSGLAELTSYFELVPWLLVFVIPAVSMRSLSEEYRSGTLEILLTKPLKVTGLITGKFTAVWLSVLLIILPSAVFVYSIYRLALPGHEPDTGILLSGFAGLLWITAVFSAIGVWVSSMTSNQMAAYLGSVFLIFIFYYGTYGLGNFDLFGTYDYLVQSFSFYPRYKHFTKGLIHLSDIFYLTGWTLIFIALAVYFVKKHQG